MDTLFSDISYREVSKASKIFQSDYIAYDDPWLETIEEINWGKV
jgi:hypothetical protein